MNIDDVLIKGVIKLREDVDKLFEINSNQPSETTSDDSDVVNVELENKIEDISKRLAALVDKQITHKNKPIESKVVYSKSHISKLNATINKQQLEIEEIKKQILEISQKIR